VLVDIPVPKGSHVCIIRHY